MGLHDEYVWLASFPMLLTPRKMSDLDWWRRKNCEALGFQRRHLLLAQYVWESTAAAAPSRRPLKRGAMFTRMLRCKEHNFWTCSDIPTMGIIPETMILLLIFNILVCSLWALLRDASRKTGLRTCAGWFGVVLRDSNRNADVRRWITEWSSHRTRRRRCQNRSLECLRSWLVFHR